MLPEGSEYRRIIKGDLASAVKHGIEVNGGLGTCEDEKIWTNWLCNHREKWRSSVMELVPEEGEGAGCAEEEDEAGGWRCMRHRVLQAPAVSALDVADALSMRALRAAGSLATARRLGQGRLAAFP